MAFALTAVKSNQKGGPSQSGDSDMKLKHGTAFIPGSSFTLPSKQRTSCARRGCTRMQINVNRKARQRVAEILAADLPRQYEAPNKLDWGIYDSTVTFDDPMTQLRGKLMYKGMILTIALIARVLFVSSAFELSECALTSDAGRVRSVFRTTGRTRWGSDVVISGIDYFWFGEKDTIVRHESTWDQTPDEVTAAFRGN